MEAHPFAEILKREYQERRSRNPRFSLRAFAQTLGVNVSTLSRLMRGKRGASPELIRAVAGKMNFDRAMTEQLILASAGLREDPGGYQNKLTPQSLEETRQMAGWEYLSIQALLETELVLSSHQQIARLLNIPVLRVKRCLDTLLKYQMVAFHEGRWKSTYKRVIAYRKDNPNVTLILQAFMDMAMKKLSTEDGEHQSFSGIVMAVDPARVPEAVRRIREFRNSLAEYLAGGHRSAVYRLGIELFPLTEVMPRDR